MWKDNKDLIWIEILILILFAIIFGLFFWYSISFAEASAGAIYENVLCDNGLTSDCGLPYDGYWPVSVHENVPQVSYIKLGPDNTNWDWNIGFGVIGAFGTTYSNGATITFASLSSDLLGRNDGYGNPIQKYTWYNASHFDLWSRSGGGAENVSYWALTDDDIIYCESACPGLEASPAIDFITPTASTTPRGEFWNWVLDIENLSTSTTYRVEVEYIQTGTQIYNLYTDTTPIYGDQTSLTLGIPKTTTLAWPTTTSTWDARANLIDNSTETVITSSTISFVMDSLQGAVSPPTGTSTLVATCDSADGFFQSSMCNLGVWLFYPSADSLNLFATLSDTYSQKPPFGYFTAYYGALNSLQSGTSTIVLMDASSTEAFSPIFSPIRTGLAWLIPLLFAVWVMIRFKHLEL